MKKRKSIFTILILFIIIVAIGLGIFLLIKHKEVKGNIIEDEIDSDILTIEQLYENGKCINKIDPRIYDAINEIKENYSIIAFDIQNQSIIDSFENSEDFKKKKINKSLQYYLINFGVCTHDYKMSADFSSFDNNDLKVKVDAKIDFVISDKETFLSKYISYEDSNLDPVIDIVNVLSSNFREIFIDDIYFSAQQGDRTKISQIKGNASDTLVNQLLGSFKLKLIDDEEFSVNGIKFIDINIEKFTINE